MKISRNKTILIHYIFDQLIPPRLRDSYWFMYIPFKILFKDKASIFFEFKERARLMTPEEYSNTYSLVSDVLVERETDLNKECIERIVEDVLGSNVLEVGCGRGYLARILSKKYDVTGIDIDISMNKNQEKLKFVIGGSEYLPFEDESFDTVVCTHTLEHVLDFEKSLSELRRVARRRVIIVVPKQRPYRYTFDLHLRFFPYLHSFLGAIGKTDRSTQCETVGGDIYYVENIK